MDKLQMAQDYIIAEVRRVGICSIDQDKIVDAWKVADAMQAEAEDRVNKDRPEVLLTKDKDGKCLHFHHEFGHKKCMDCGASLEEWQPDWSQAPEWANWWAMDDCDYFWWYEKSPEMKNGGWCVSWTSDDFEKAPSFDYQGNWKESLRKRPQ